MNKQAILKEIFSSVKIAYSSDAPADLMNYHNAKISEFMKKEIPMNIIVEFLKVKMPVLRFFGLKIMQDQVRRFWSGKFIPQYKKKFLECVLSFSTDSKDLNEVLLEKCAGILFDILYREWPEKNNKLLHFIVKQLTGKGKSILALKVIRNICQMLGDEHTLDINVERQKKVRGFFVKESGLLDDVEGLIMNHFQKKIHLVQTIDTLRSLIRFLDESRIEKYVKILFKTFTVKQLKESTADCLEEVAKFIPNNLVVLVEYFPKVIKLNEKFDREFYLKMMVYVSKKLEKSNPENSFSRKKLGFNKAALYSYFHKIIMFGGYSYDERKQLLIIGHNLSKSLKKGSEANFDILKMFERFLILCDLPKLNPASFPVGTEPKEIKAIYRHNQSDLVHRTKTVFQFLLRFPNFVAKIIPIILKRIYNFKKFPSQFHFELFCTMFEVLNKGISMDQKKQFAGQYNALLKLLLKNFKEPNQEVKKKFVGLVKYFDVCFLDNFISLKYVISGLFQLGVQEKESRELVMNEWIKLCSMNSLLLIRNFHELFEINKKIKKVYNTKEILQFYEGLIIISNKSVKVSSSNTMQTGCPDEIVKNHMKFISFLLDGPIQAFTSSTHQNTISKTSTFMKELLTKKLSFELFFLVELFAKFGAQIETPALVPYFVKILPSLISLTKTIHSLYHPDTMIKIPDQYKFMLIFNSLSQHNDVCREMCLLKKNLYKCLGYCCEYVKQFWENPNLIGIMNNSVFKNFPYFGVHNIKVIMKHFVLPFLNHCPKSKNKVMIGGMMVPVLQIVSKKLNDFTNKSLGKDSQNHLNEEIFLDEQRGKYLKYVAKVIALFKKGEDPLKKMGNEMMDNFGFSRADFLNSLLYDYLKTNDQLFLILLEICIKFFHLQRMKYFYLFREFIESLLSDRHFTQVNKKFEIIFSFYTLKALVYLYTHITDAHQQVSISQLIARIFVTFRRSKYAEYVFLKIGGKGKYANLLEKIMKRGMRFKKRSRSVRTFLQPIAGRKKVIVFSLNEINEKQIERFEALFHQYNKNMVVQLYKSQQ